jgi:hypothetical protein
MAEHKHVWGDWTDLEYDKANHYDKTTRKCKECPETETQEHVHVCKGKICACGGSEAIGV